MSQYRPFQVQDPGGSFTFAPPLGGGTSFPAAFKLVSEMTCALPDVDRYTFHVTDGEPPASKSMSIGGVSITVNEDGTIDIARSGDEQSV